MRVIDSELELSFFELSIVPIHKDENGKTAGNLRFLICQNFDLFDLIYHWVCANCFVRYLELPNQTA